MNAEAPLLAKMPSGDWLQFSNESKARSFIVDFDNAQLYHTPNDLAQRGMDELKRDYLKLIKIPYCGAASNSTIAIELWSLLLTRAKNPLASLEGKAKGDGKTLGKRASLIYKCQYTGKDDDALKPAFEKLPKQAKVVLLIIMELEAKLPYVDSRTLELELNKRADELATRQNPWRVAKYYQALMISEGLLRLQRR